MTALLALTAAVVCAGCAAGGPGSRTFRVTPAKSPPRASLASAVGASIRSATGRSPNPDADRRLGRSVGAVGVTMVLSVELALALALAATIRPIAARRAAARQRDRAVLDGLPEVIDLYGVALRSGRNVTAATREVAKHGSGPIVEALRGCLDQSGHGRPLTEALGELPDTVGPPVRPLIAALVASDRHGAPINDSLIVLATDARLHRRRDAETRARRVPVKMLFPLVFCILPAFMLLTVVPVLVDALAVLDP